MIIEETNNKIKENIEKIYTNIKEIYRLIKIDKVTEQHDISEIIMPTTEKSRTGLISYISIYEAPEIETENTTIILETDNKIIFDIYMIINNNKEYIALKYCNKDGLPKYPIQEQDKGKIIKKINIEKNNTEITGDITYTKVSEPYSYPENEEVEEHEKNPKHETEEILGELEKIKINMLKEKTIIEKIKNERERKNELKI